MQKKQSQMKPSQKNLQISAVVSTIFVYITFFQPFHMFEFLQIFTRVLGLSDYWVWGTVIFIWLSCLGTGTSIMNREDFYKKQIDRK